MRESMVYMAQSSILLEAGFTRWKVVSGKYRLRIGSVRMEIQINTKIKPQDDNSQKTIKIGHNDPLTSINI